MKIILSLSLLFVLLTPTLLLAHPGRTDGSGCHTCRTNCPNWGLSSGSYHCHNSKGVPQPKEPIRSTYGDPVGSTRVYDPYKNDTGPIPSPYTETNPTYAPQRSVSSVSSGGKSGDSSTGVLLLVGGGAYGLYRLFKK